MVRCRWAVIVVTYLEAEHTGEDTGKGDGHASILVCVALATPLGRPAGV